MYNVPELILLFNQNEIVIENFFAGYLIRINKIFIN